MNLLIIGGLMAIALVAILAAVLLGLSEQRAEKARASASPASSAGAPPAAETSVAAGQPDVENAPIRQALPSAKGPGKDEQALSALNGQFHEFASELRSLYQQAWELEQRLRSLTETVDRVEEVQSSRVSIEEDVSAHPQPDNL
jgi:peptidoglycan hydrolase CwlO-like protein